MHLADFHPAVVHFPISLLSIGLFCDLLNGMGKKEALPFAHWAIIVGALLCFPALVTGWEEAATRPPETPYLVEHRLFAFVTVAIALFHGLFRFTVVRKGWTFPPLLFVSCSVVNVLALALTADYGGRITHGVSLFVWW